MNKEIDHDNTDEIVCPHCGYEHRDSWDFFSYDYCDDSTESECGSCGLMMIITREFDVKYSTSKPKETAR